MIPDASSVATDDDAAMAKVPAESRAKRELHHLEQVAETGESGETPAILIGAVWVVYAVAFLVVLAVALFAYDLAK
jgi:hypothetical protein